ncbi:ABC transporter ATP-binding protein [Clostridium butyricum]|uniref:ABC transporter ATP-binding protein n=1 Tax=Clostridium butyricum TaxID=1492 RepID=A0AAP9RC92_CLOBU|nr:ABC transporter ATP-binding protein [Clostridium butyricum]MBZ5745859.1 ABC transporter ATP-binding protein [Clostridium butyricum]MCQ2016443.1 ABC transporter ATP-binding protein [Clostridium butyricum]MCQ2023412.1 ABC transporter ATP-binding protein [Clostridium butyricum]MDI9210509.1 ABC transporter ATP-binding protein [Clostridium butyricum]NFB72271.1 ABC transporter ATP-binding protein [Clostridium butyricum]
MKIIKAIGINRTYGSGENKVDALKNINLEIEKGEFIAIVGASGSGKSSLLHILGGIDKPTCGEIYIDGVSLKELSEDEISLIRLRKIGFVFQFYNLISVLTVEENIEMPVLLDDGLVDEDYKNEIISFLGLENKRNNLITDLSGGQQQRVAIGRALINRPSIILADEPTGNLDSKNARDIISLLKYSIRKYNQTLVLITHDDNIAKMADRIIAIKDGEIAVDEVRQ